MSSQMRSAYTTGGEKGGRDVKRAFGALHPHGESAEAFPKHKTRAGRGALKCSIFPGLDWTL